MFIIIIFSFDLTATFEENEASLHVLEQEEVKGNQ
jgi:hypothetical protein